MQGPSVQLDSIVMLGTGFTYSLSTLRQDDNFADPNCVALLASARKTRDR